MAGVWLQRGSGSAAPCPLHVGVSRPILLYSKLLLWMFDFGRLIFIMPATLAGADNRKGRKPAPACARARGLRGLKSIAWGDDANPLVNRATHAVASIAVFLSLAMPAYIAPQHATAQAPTAPAPAPAKEQSKGPSRSPVLNDVAKASLSTDASVKKIQEKAELFGEILADLQDLYVEPVDLDKLAETGFQAMLTSLDPYTEFENVEAAKVMRTQTIGNYGGVGLVIAKNHDKEFKDAPYITVQNAFEGYAYDAGMRVGDTLVAVDGKDVKDTSTNDVSLMLKGEPGSKVELKYKRPGVDGIQTCELTRKIVLLRDVPLGMTLGKDDERIGYVKLQGFSTSAAAELAYVIGQLQAEAPLKSLILDLRGNPGGLLSSAIKVSELFINEGDKIVTTRGRTLSTGPEAASAAATPSPPVVPSPKDKTVTAPAPSKAGEKRSTFETTYNSDPIAMRIPNGQQQVVFHPPLLNKETKLVVLVNKGTASAAEIVSGAIQDHDRGIILGETTYGKGLVQQLQRLGQGGQQIKFTIGKYYTPSGRCIQSKTYTTKSGQLGTDEVVVKDQDRKVYYTDGGRQVRDGGGIEPDIVKKDPKVGQLERELDRKDMFFDYAAIYESKHLEDGEKLSRAQEPLVTDEVYADFQQWVLKEMSNQVESPFDKSLDIMKTALEETGYTEALREVETLKTKLKTLTKEEFKKDQARIKKRLDLALRQRFVPDSIVTSIALFDDEQVGRAGRPRVHVCASLMRALFAAPLKCLRPLTGDCAGGRGLHLGERFPEIRWYLGQQGKKPRSSSRRDQGLGSADGC